MMKRLTVVAVVISIFYTYFISKGNLCAQTMDIPVDFYILVDISKTIDKQKSSKVIEILNAILNRISTAANDYNNCHRISISIMGGDFCEIRPLDRFDANRIDNFKNVFAMLFSEDQPSKREIDRYFQRTVEIDRKRTDFRPAFSKLKNILSNRNAGRNSNCAFVVITDGIQDPKDDVQTSSTEPSEIKNKKELQQQINKLLQKENDSNGDLFFFFFHLDEIYETFWREQCNLYLGAYYTSRELNFPGHQVEEMFQIAGKKKFFQIEYGEFEAQEVSKVYRLCMTAKTNINDDILYELKIEERDNQPIKFIHSIPTFLRVERSSGYSYSFEKFILYFMLPPDIKEGKFKPEFELIPKFSNANGIQIINEPPELEVKKEKEKINFHPNRSPIFLNKPGGTTEFNILFSANYNVNPSTKIGILVSGNNGMPGLISGMVYEISSQGNTPVKFTVNNDLPSGLMTGTLKFRTSRDNRPIYCIGKDEDNQERELLTLNFFTPDSFYETCNILSIFCFPAILGLVIFWIFKRSSNIVIIKIGGTKYKKRNFPLKIGNEYGNTRYIKVPLADIDLGTYNIAQLELRKGEGNFLIWKKLLKTIDRITIINAENNEFVIDNVEDTHPILPGEKISINGKHEFKVEISNDETIKESGLFKKIKLPFFEISTQINRRARVFKKSFKIKVSKERNEICLISFIILFLLISGSASILINLCRTGIIFNGWDGYISTFLSFFVFGICLSILVKLFFRKNTQPDIYSKDKKKSILSVLAFFLQYIFDILDLII